MFILTRPTLLRSLRWLDEDPRLPRLGIAAPPKIGSRSREIGAPTRTASFSRGKRLREDRSEDRCRVCLVCWVSGTVNSSGVFDPNLTATRSAYPKTIALSLLA